jgi:hypothetical protein
VDGSVRWTVADWTVAVDGWTVAWQWQVAVGGSGWQVDSDMAVAGGNSDSSGGVTAMAVWQWQQ